MTRMPFIVGRLPDPDFSKPILQERFRKHWKKIRAAKFDASPPPEKVDDGQLDLSLTDARNDALIMPMQVAKAMTRRIDLLIERDRKNTIGQQLPERDLEKLQGARLGVEMVPIVNEHRADEIAAEVHAECPWMAPATEVLWHAMRTSVRDGHAGFRMAPMLLDGPPGIGKSSWARFVAKQIQVPSVALDASGEAAGFGIIGLQRGWSGAHPGRPVAMILESLIGNPVVVIDEIEKAGPQSNTRGNAFSLHTALLPLLERSTAQGWNCPYYRIGFDMSWISWILTANEAVRMPAPLRSRCVELSLRNLTNAELIGFVRREQGRRGLSDAVTDAAVEALQRAGHRRTQPNLRTAQRMLDLAALQDSRLEVH